jgi:hypothetical protein
MKHKNKNAKIFILEKRSTGLIFQKQCFRAGAILEIFCHVVLWSEPELRQNDRVLQKKHTAL